MNLVSSDFYNILSQVSDQEVDPDQIFAVFKKEISSIATKYGYVLFRAYIYEPIKRSAEMSISKKEIYNAITDDSEADIINFEFGVGRGGKVVVNCGIARGCKWTDGLREDAYFLSRMIYLLAGRARAMHELNYLMFYDQMTGISNETGLNRFMGQTLENGLFARYSTNFINLKNMKLLNSRYGNKAGDAVMVGFANAVNVYAQKFGAGIAARLGGDNFLVFIDKSKQEDFLDFVENITIPYSREGGDTVYINVDCRVGYYIIEPGDVINEAMRNADIAAKMARQPNQPDFVRFEKSMQIQIFKARQLEQSIPAAIENKEFVVYYQPKVDISDPQKYLLNGAEALVRWQKNDGLVPPVEFIPILEKSGMIALIDYYVLEQVCCDINDWIARGIEPVKISTNFSRRHLQDRAFADKVENIIRKHGVDPKYIEIEITESYDDEDMQALHLFETKMHALGINLAVDDFGSGFSSIKMIKNIVADTIKLDKSLIDGIGDNGPDDIIISHMIMMLNKLGKNIIAEGVETIEQAKMLRENGCTNIQGFLYSKPCPKQEFEKHMM